MNRDSGPATADESAATSSRPSLTRANVKTGFSRRTVASLAVGLAISTVAIWAAARFQRQPPPPPPEMTGVLVSGSAISILPGAPQWQTLKLGKAQPVQQHWSDSVPARITVDETRASRVGAALGGRVSKVLVELGQSVKAGVPLFSVASAELAALQSERAKSKVQLEANRIALDRVSAIVQARALPEKEQVAAAQQLKQAELDYRVAQAKLDLLRVELNSDSEFVVKSPRDGIVVEKNVLPGQQIDSGSTSNLMMVADLSSVWVVAELFESDGSTVTAGAQARVSVTSLPGVTLEGRVQMVSSIVDPERYSVPVRVQLANPAGKLKPNTYGRMQFLRDPVPGSVEVDATAVVSDGARQYVYVRGRDGSFARQDVVTGPTQAGKTLVLRGLGTHETVVQRGAILLDNQIALSQ